MTVSNQARYILYGDFGGWESYNISGDDLKALKLEGLERLKMGYSAFILDKQNPDSTIQLSLKDPSKKDKTGV